jgi:hypothetical protein
MVAGGPSAAWSALRPGDSGPLAPADEQKLSPQSLAEAESRYQAILAQYPDRFSEAPKADIKHVCLVTQQSLDRLRAYTVANGDQPALYLKPVVEREKKGKAPPNLKSAISKAVHSSAGAGETAASQLESPDKPAANAPLPTNSEKR